MLDEDSSPRTDVHMTASTVLLAGTDSQHPAGGLCSGGLATGLTEGEEFRVSWVSPACRHHLPEVSPGTGSGGHLNNRNTGKELVVYR